MTNEWAHRRLRLNRAIFRRSWVSRRPRVGRRDHNAGGLGGLGMRSLSAEDAARAYATNGHPRRAGEVDRMITAAIKVDPEMVLAWAGYGGAVQRRKS